MTKSTFLKIFSLNLKFTSLTCRQYKEACNPSLEKLKSSIILLFLSFSLLACSMDISLNSANSNSNDSSGPIVMGKGLGLCSEGYMNGITPLDRDSILIWGEYNQIGNCEPSVAILNPSSLSYAKLKSKILGIEFSIADGHGGWYISGRDLKVNNKSIKHIAHISSDGTLNPNFKAFSNVENGYLGQIESMKLANDRLYVAGDLYTTMNPNGGPVDLVNGDSFYPPSLRERGVYGKNSINTISAAVSDGAGGFFLSGRFREYLGESVGGLIHVNANGQRTKSFNPTASGEVSKIHYDEDTKILYLVGDFFAINGKPRFGLAAIDTLNGNLLNWSPILSNSRRYNSKFTISSKHGRAFVYDGNENKSKIEIYDLTSGASVGSYEIAGSGSHEVEALYVLEDRLYVGGLFSSLQGVTRRNLGAIDLTSNTVANWDPDPNGTVRDIKASPDGSELFLAGSFNSVSGGLRIYLASVNPITGNLNTFNLPVTLNDQIYEIAVSANTVYIKGWFNKVGTQYRYRYAAFDRLTGNLTPWNPAKIKEEYSPNSLSYANTMAVSANSIFIIANHIGEESRGGMFVLNSTTGEELPFKFNSGLDRNRFSYSESFSLSEDGSLLFVGGQFQKAGDSERLSLAVFNTADLSLNSKSFAMYNGVAKRVVATDVYKNTLYVGGYFTSMGSNNLNRHHLAAIDINTGQATSWDPSPDEALNGFYRKNSDLYVFGKFSNILGQARDGFAAIDLIDGSLKPLTIPIEGSSILSVVQVENILFIRSWYGLFKLSLDDNNFSQLNNEDGAGPGLSESNGKILIHDDYVSYRTRTGITAKNLAIFDLQTRKPAPFPLSIPDGSIETVLKLSENSFAIMGFFTDENLFEDYGLLIADLKEKKVTKFKTDGGVQSGALVNGVLYISGDFTEIEGLPLLSAAAINLDDLSLSNWSPQIDTSDLDEYFITGIGGDKNQIYVAYSAISLTGESLGRVQRFDATGTPDNWILETNDSIESMKISKELLILTGEFSAYNNKPAWKNLFIDLNNSEKNLFENVLLNTPDPPEFLGISPQKIWLSTYTDEQFNALIYSRRTMNNELSSFFSRIDKNSWVVNLQEDNGFIYILGDLHETNGDFSSLRVIRESDGKFRY